MAIFTAIWPMSLASKYYYSASLYYAISFCVLLKQLYSSTFSMIWRVQLPKKKASIVATICSNQNLANAVKILDTSILLKVIERIGLEDSAAIVALCSESQLNELMDLDVWQQTPGQADEFESERFALWLEILVQLEPSETYKKIMQLDENFLVLGLSERIAVMDRQGLDMYFWQTGLPPKVFEELSESSLSVEFDHYFVFSRIDRHWDAVVILLNELNERNPSHFQEIMARLAIVSESFENEWEEFSERLSERESLKEDVGGARDNRRTAKGFVPPLVAKSFFRLIGQRDLESLLADDDADTITKSYFKALKEDTSPHRPSLPEELVHLLREYNVIDANPSPKDNPKLTSDSSSPFRVYLMSNQTLEKELAYLSNLVISGIDNEGFQFRPMDAVDITVDLLERGYHYLVKNQALQEHHIAEIVQNHGLVKLFKIGYRSGNIKSSSYSGV